MITGEIGDHTDHTEIGDHTEILRGIIPKS